jgi:hypothetical protein
MTDLTQSAASQFKIDPEAFPSTLTDSNKQNKVKDSPRLAYLKINLAFLVEKISVKSDEPMMEILKDDLANLLGMIKSVFENGMSDEEIVLMAALGKLTISGRARILKTIENCEEIPEVKKKIMKKMIVDAAPR